MASWPCSNTECASFGRPHPHCLCAPPDGHTHEDYAQGGCVGEHKEDCEYFADGGTVERNQQFIQNPTLAVDHAIAKNGLLHTLTKTGHSKSPEPTMGHQDFLNHTRGGHTKTHEHVGAVFGKTKPSPVETNIEALDEHLDQLSQNPSELFSVGGDLGLHYPMHATALAAKAASAMNFLKSQKPMGTQTSPLGRIMPPTPIEMAQYHRKLRIAENPLSILSRVKNGTVTPSEVSTLQTIYPELLNAMTSKAFEHLVEANGKISNKQKAGLSTLMGQPLDYIQTPAALQAVLHAGMAQAAQPEPQDKSKKASGVELKQINKVDALSATPLQRIDMDKKA